LFSAGRLQGTATSVSNVAEGCNPTPRMRMQAILVRPAADDNNLVKPRLERRDQPAGKSQGRERRSSFFTNEVL
jgi:hypothetical protein